ncbi:hypothetical protein Aduo_011408 [Ancylostoma duodenale]
MTNNDSMDDLDLERLLLDDPTAAEQIATMRALIDRLIGTVQKLAENNAAQVNSVCEVMSSKIKTIQTIPDSFLENSAKKRKETERAAFSLLDAECKIMYAQLAKLKKVGHKLTTLARFMEQKGSSIMQEQVQQAEYDDLCMEELARLLKVNTSEVLEETKRLVTMSNREQSPYS